MATLAEFAPIDPLHDNLTLSNAVIADIALNATRCEALTQVQTDETTVGSLSHARSNATAARPLAEEGAKLNLTWRHSGWADRRSRTLVAMQEAGLTADQCSRFAQCGSCGWVQRSNESNPRYRVSCNRCRSRWCDPCSQEHRRIVTRNLASYLDTLGDQKIRFVTLTLKSAMKPLTQQLDRLIACWKKLRHSDLKKCFGGGISFLELTVSKGLWHVHLHTLVQGSYIAKEQLSAVWRECTGDSFIVDIRLIPTKTALGYVAKYAQKCVNSSVWSSREHYKEAIASLQGRRSMATWGTWTKLKLNEVPTDDATWETIAPLDVIIAGARDGHAESQEIMRMIVRTACHTVDAPREDST